MITGNTGRREGNDTTEPLQGAKCTTTVHSHACGEHASMHPVSSKKRQELWELTKKTDINSQTKSARMNVRLTESEAKIWVSLVLFRKLIIQQSYSVKLAFFCILHPGSLRKSIFLT